MTSPVHIVWFKRDLRIDDHEALRAAADAGVVLPIYVYETDLLVQPTADARHIDFANQCLSELDDALRALGSPLVFRTGTMPAVLDRLSDELAALDGDHVIASLRSHQETTDLEGFRRDVEVNEWCATNRVERIEYIDRGVIRRLATRDGWSKKWKATMSRPIVKAPGRIDGTLIEAGSINAATDLGFAPSTCVDLQPGGRAAGVGVLDSFLTERGEPYAIAMSSPVTSFEHSSRISAHFAFGTLSGKEVYQATLARIAEVKDDPDRGMWLKSLRAFEKRQHWRDHFTQKLEDQPSLEIEAMHPMLDDLRPGLDSERYERFVNGTTGYPMVDACMRATAATGWLNFRMRAMVVSFATYHLWLDWRPVAEHLARMWTDYEAGIHYPQHQMQSGSTGINTLRIYSPTKQVTDHDPTGVFVRRWVPELSDVPDKHLAEPHLRPPDLLSADSHYPSPLVDHATATKEARDRIGAIRRTPEAKKISDEIVERHGSRRPSPRTKRAAAKKGAGRKQTTGKPSASTTTKEKAATKAAGSATGT